MNHPQCAKCKLKPCRKGDSERELLPDFCPMKNFKEIIQQAMMRYSRTEEKKLYLAATIGEKEAHEDVRGVKMAVWPRIREIAELAKRMNVKNIGMAFCGGLSDEADRAADVLEGHGLTIHSICCKCGGVDKSRLVPPDCKISGPEKFEAACNPITQAEVLNKIKTDFNVIVGLCVGHDMLFTMASQAPVTTLIAKDRVTGHNPLASLYAGYCRRLT